MHLRIPKTWRGLDLDLDTDLGKPALLWPAEIGVCLWAWTGSYVSFYLTPLTFLNGNLNPDEVSQSRFLTSG